MKQKIFSDAFNISKRVKQIDKNYYLVFNFKTNKFELYSKLYTGVVLTLPYDQLDFRSLNFIRKKLTKSNEEVLKEVELHNENYLKAINKKIVLDAVDSAERALRRR